MIWWSCHMVHVNSFAVGIECQILFRRNSLQFAWKSGWGLINMVISWSFLIDFSHRNVDRMIRFTCKFANNFANCSGWKFQLTPCDQQLCFKVHDGTFNQISQMMLILWLTNDGLKLEQPNGDQTETKRRPNGEQKETKRRPLTERLLKFKAWTHWKRTNVTKS